MKNLIAALIEAQKELKSIRTDSQNPHFKNRYASLEAVIGETKPVLLKHGLVVTQPTHFDFATGFQVVKTTLCHTSGETLESSYVLRPAKEDPQGYGSALSYGRRYCLLSILCLADTDDDGHTASRQQTQSAAPRPVQTTMAASPGPSEPQLKRLFAISKKNGWSEDDVRDYLDQIGIKSTKDMTIPQYDYLCNAMEKYPKNKED